MPRDGPSRVSRGNPTTAAGREMERARTPHGEVNTPFSFIRNQNQLSMCRPSDDVDLGEMFALIEVKIKEFIGSSSSTITVSCRRI